MRHVYSVYEFESFTVDEAIAVLPEGFSFENMAEQPLLVVEAPDAASEEQVFSQVRQECDRIFFLSGVQLNPRFLRKEMKDGTIKGGGTIDMGWHIVRGLPADLDRQCWTTKLPVQLRLWQVSRMPGVPIAARVNLLFQVIEVEYPDTRDQAAYPPYADPRKTPHPRTEAKLLRDLASHGAATKMRSKQLDAFCKHFGITRGFHDPTDADYLKHLKARLPALENEAKRVIDNSVTRQP